MFGGTTLHAAHDHAAPEAPGREAPPVEGEAGEPDGAVERGGRADCAAHAHVEGLVHGTPSRRRGLRHLYPSLPRAMRQRFGRVKAEPGTGALRPPVGRAAE